MKKVRIMKKAELIESLIQYETSWKGQATFSKYLVHLLRTQDSKLEDCFGISVHLLVDFAVDAFEQLRTSDDPQDAVFRQMYEDETGHVVPNILDVGASNVYDQIGAIQTTLGFLFEKVTGNENFGNAFDKYCNAQRHVIQQTFDKFLRKVYRQGLFDLISNCKVRGMGGKFGNTQLRTYSICGRQMFTFALAEEDDEQSITFIAEDGDPLCYNAGIQSIYTDFRTSLDLIDDVIAHWPEVKKAGGFSENQNISIG